MKITIDDASALPEALQSLVSETDEGKQLDLGQVAPASELERFKAKALKAEEEAIERRKALQSWKSLGDDPDEVKSALEDARKGKGKSEEHEAIVARMKQDHEAKMAEMQERLTGTFRKQTTAELKAQLAEAGVVPEGLDLLAGYAAQRIQFSDDGTPKVLAKDGSGPMVGSGANGGATLADLAKELAGSIPHLVADKGAGGSGKQPGANGGKPGQQTVTRDQWGQMSHIERRDFAKSGGQIVDS